MVPGMETVRSGEVSLWPKALRHARQQGAMLRLNGYLLRIERTRDASPTLSFGALYMTRTVSEKPNFSGMIGLDSWYLTD